MAVFPTHKEWTDLKTKYGIPEKIIKSGSFGSKMDALTKQYVTKKLDKVTPANAAVAEQVFPNVIKLADDWLTGATKLKPEAFKNGKPSKDGKANREKAIDAVKEYRKYAVMFVDRYAALKDPFLSARVGGRDKCVKAFRAAMANPEDHHLLHDLYNGGVRNDLGMGFQMALKGYQGTPEVMAMLTQYNKQVAAYNDIMLNAKDGGPPAIAASPAKRKKYLDDMKALILLGDKILAATKE
jgi:hypothetical protein